MRYKVVEHKTNHKQHAGEGMRYQPEVAKGTTVWAVVHEPTGLEFSYAYLNRDFAEHIAAKFQTEPVGIEANFGRSYIIISDRRMA